MEEYSNGLKSFDNWNSLKQDKFAVQINISACTKSIIHFEVDLQIDSLIALKDLFLQLKFLPQNPASWSKCRKDFHWIPNIKSKPSQIASDHVFRSPVVLMMAALEATAHCVTG